VSDESGPVKSARKLGKSLLGADIHEAVQRGP
jgi:hypothetical protein